MKRGETGTERGAGERGIGGEDEFNAVFDRPGDEVVVRAGAGFEGLSVGQIA